MISKLLDSPKAIHTVRPPLASNLVKSAEVFQQNLVLISHFFRLFKPNAARRAQSVIYKHVLDLNLHPLTGQQYEVVETNALKVYSYIASPTF